jgi:hypothetical protein
VHRSLERNSREGGPVGGRDGFGRKGGVEGDEGSCTWSLQQSQTREFEYHEVLCGLVGANNYDGRLLRHWRQVIINTRWAGFRWSYFDGRMPRCSFGTLVPEVHAND